MRLKSYFAPSVDTAIQRARRELGDEALLLNSRPAPKEAAHLGAFEVVFGLAETPEPDPAASATRDLDAQLAQASSRQILEDLVAVRDELHRMKAAVARSSAFSLSAASLVREPELAALFWSLLDADFPPDLAQEIVANASRTVNRDSSGRLPVGQLQMSIRQQIEQRIQVHTELGAGRRAGTRVIAFVGPPGAGKTSALVKLAVSHGLKTRRPMQVLSLDSVRIGASEQLRTYSMILGVGFTSCDTTQSLHLAVEEHKSKDWIWIDTPGLSTKDQDAGQELAAFLASHQEIDVHLVLSAAMRTADLTRAVERYAKFRPSKLLFTHLDETDSYGALFSVPLEAAKPVSFLSLGQRIPEDLEPAAVERLLSLVMQRVWAQVPQPGWFLPQAGRAAAGL